MNNDSVNTELIISLSKTNSNLSIRMVKNGFLQKYAQTTSQLEISFDSFFLFFSIIYIHESKNDLAQK